MGLKSDPLSERAQHQSYGIVPLKKKGGEWQVLLIRREKGFWEFPKGHAEGDEDPLTAATRELKEETGLDVERLLIDDPYQFSYFFKLKGALVDKTVFYYVAEVKGRVQLQVEEVHESRWMPWKKAAELLTYDNLKKLVAQIDEELSGVL